MTLPSIVDSQLAKAFNSSMAASEPDRYAALAATGFPVLDARDEGADLVSYLIERGGGHYMGVGATRLLVQGKVGVKANTEPIAFTATGLRFADGSEMEADAVVWCSGFADKDVRATAAEILGGTSEASAAGEVSSASEVGEGGKVRDPNILYPADIASRLDATWRVDSEGEIRGMWKRPRDMEHYWVAGGYTSLHRWHSKTLALQIKAALEGILPPAYRDTPVVKVGC